jgi:hypothetical protein
MERFPTISGVDSIPIFPFVKAVSFWINFIGLLDDICATWGLVQPEPSLFSKNKIRRQIVSAIFDTNFLVFLGTQAADIFGFTNAPLSAKLFAQLVAHVVMIHDELFTIQSAERAHTPYVTPLTELELSRQLEKYRDGKLRGHLWQNIEGSSFIKAIYSKDQVRGIILEAVRNNRSVHKRKQIK